jgi:hypothetical protein
MESHLFVRLLVVLGPVPGARRVAGLAVLIIECDDRRHERFTGGLPLAQVGVGEHQLAIRDDLQVGAGAGDVLTLGGAHHDAAGPADAEIQLGDRDGVWLGREPLLEQLWLAKAAEQLRARRVDQPGQRQFVIGRHVTLLCVGAPRTGLLAVPRHWARKIFAALSESTVLGRPLGAGGRKGGKAP